MTAQTDGYPAPALAKGLAILELLADEPEPLSMMMIAKRLGRTHNEIYRMLLALERSGYIVREPNDRLSLSDKIFLLAMQNPKRRNLHDAAMPVMHMLAERLWQSCHLTVISGLDITVVARVESPDMAGFAVRVGYRRPILNSTSGRILYTHQPERVRASLRDALKASGADPATIDDLESSVAEVVGNGSVVHPSPAFTSVTDVAAPIFNRQAEGAVASLNVPFVSGPAAHTTIEVAAEIVRQAGMEITRNLGR